MLKSIEFPFRFIRLDDHKSVGILIFGIFVMLYFILSSTEIIKFTRKAKARGLNGLVSIIIIEDC